MAKWSLKNRNNDNTGSVPKMPPELSDYYNAEKRDRMWATWLLGFATLVVTVLLAVLLFLGGRWVVDQFTGDEVESPTTTQNEPGSQSTDDSAPTVGNSDDDSSVAGNNDQNEDQSETGGVVSDEAAVTDQPLPDTGPGNLITVFFAVAVLATLTHSKFIRQN